MAKAKFELVAESDLGGRLDDDALKGLRTAVDAVKELRGSAELLYRDGRWVLRVFREAKLRPVERPALKPPVKAKPGPKPKAPKKSKPTPEFLEKTAKNIVAKDPSLADKPLDVLKALRQAAREKGYAARIAPKFVQALLKRLA